MLADSRIERLAEASSDAELIKGRSLWQDAWRRFLMNKAAVVSVVALPLIGARYFRLVASVPITSASLEQAELPAERTSRVIIS